MRSNAKKTPARFILGYKHVENNRPYPAVDSTKSIILTDKEIEKNKCTAILPRRTYKYLKENENIIKQKFENHLEDYVNTVAKGNQNKPNVRFSTLQYYHNELDLSTKIAKKMLKNDIK